MPPYLVHFIIFKDYFHLFYSFEFIYFFILFFWRNLTKDQNNYSDGFENIQFFFFTLVIGDTQFLKDCHMYLKTGLISSKVRNAWYWSINFFFAEP